MFSRFTIQTRLSPVEAERALGQLVRPKVYFLDPDPPTTDLRPLVGRVDRDSFKFRRVIPGRNNVLPIIFLLIVTVAAGCARSPTGEPRILLFTGTGTSRGDVAALETILLHERLAYATADSAQLNAIPQSRLREYRLLIVPGGNFIDIGTHLTSNATANIRGAIRDGVSYLGVCAGGFFAGDTGHNGLNLATGTRFHFYAAEADGIRKAPVRITDVTGRTLDQYWEDGPEFTGWGAVIANYPDRTPAIVEGTYGRGWVVLTGVHPEAPASWRRGMRFTTPVEADNAYASTLVDAALNRISLAHR